MIHIYFTPYLVQDNFWNLSWSHDFVIEQSKLQTILSEVN